MLLNDVVMGKTIKLTTTDENLTEVRTASEFVEMFPGLYLEPTQPPAGYDSVVGEPGGDLNYDEAVGAYRPVRDHQGQWTLTANADCSV